MSSSSLAAGAGRSAAVLACAGWQRGEGLRSAHSQDADGFPQAQPLVASSCVLLLHTAV